MLTVGAHCRGVRGPTGAASSTGFTHTLTPLLSTALLHTSLQYPSSESPRGLGANAARRSMAATAAGSSGGTASSPAPPPASPLPGATRCRNPRAPRCRCRGWRGGWCGHSWCPVCPHEWSSAPRPGPSAGAGAGRAVRASRWLSMATRWATAALNLFTEHRLPRCRRGPVGRGAIQVEDRNEREHSK